MHDYSIDKHPKEKILFFLAFIAIAATPLVRTVVQAIVSYMQLSIHWTSPPVVAIPVLTIFMLLYFLFNQYLWRISYLRKFLLVPDLNGTWDCEGLRTLKDGVPSPEEWQGTMSITQSWSKILIYLETPKSESKSISASIYHEEGVGYRMLYQYDNKPNDEELDLRKHSGAAELVFSENALEANGSYYTDRHRTTVGTMKLIRRVNGVSSR